MGLVVVASRGKRNTWYRLNHSVIFIVHTYFKSVDADLLTQTEGPHAVRGPRVGYPRAKFCFRACGINHGREGTKNFQNLKKKRVQSKLQAKLSQMTNSCWIFNQYVLRLNHIVVFYMTVH